MRNTRLIHALADIPELFEHADALRLQVIENARLPTAEERRIAPAEFQSQTKGSFYLLRKEWVFGLLKFNYIDNNPNFPPFYDLRPRTNYIALHVFFSVQHNRPEGKGLGIGDLGCPDSWLSHPGLEVFATPPEVTAAYLELLKAIRKGGKVISDRHRRYLIMRHARRKLESGNYLMPVL